MELLENSYSIKTFVKKRAFPDLLQSLIFASTYITKSAIGGSLKYLKPTRILNLKSMASTFNGTMRVLITTYAANITFKNFYQSLTSMFLNGMERFKDLMAKQWNISCLFGEKTGQRTSVKYTDGKEFQQINQKFSIFMETKI
jgi:hypothetical protein